MINPKIYKEYQVFAIVLVTGPALVVSYQYVTNKVTNSQTQQCFHNNNVV